MASNIKIAVGHNNVAGLSLFEISPDLDEIQHPRTIDAADGSGYFDGSPFVPLRFPDVMEPGVWVRTLGKAGLGDPSVRRVKVTVRLPDEDKVTYRNYNARATRPQNTSFDYCWYESPVILITRLELIP